MLMLEYHKIKHYLPSNIPLSFFQHITSTNSYLLAIDNTCPIQICVAKYQTKGRGQYNRVWYAQNNYSILFSLRYKFAFIPPSNLSLAVGICIAQTLENYGVDNIGLKWPNDIYYKNQKLAGILIENQVIDNNFFSIIGIGINAIPFDNTCNYAFLSDILNKRVDFNEIVAKIMVNLLKTCSNFLNKDFKIFKKQWQKYDIQINKKVFYKNKQANIIGIDNEGKLLINIDSNIIPIISSKQINY